jgi:hypothetical protein
MNRDADEKLRAAAREWLEASPAEGVSLNVESVPGKAPVFVLVGTEAQLYKVRPEDMVGALRQAWEALDALLHPEVPDPRGRDPEEVMRDTRTRVANAWQATKYHLDRLK